MQTDSEVRVLFGSAVDLRRTSLALLAFVGSGYTPTWNLSLWDPALKRCHTPRDVTRRALHWILSKQDDHGFFSTDDPVSNVLAALAVCEMYGWTEMATLKEPAMKGIAAVRASRSTDRSFLIWKGVLLESARVLELQPADTEVMRQLGEALVAEESLPARFGGVLLLRLAGTRNYFMPRMPDVNLDASSPEEAWLASTAAIKVWGRKSREWVSLRETFIARLKAKPEDPVCEGAAVTDDGICTAAFRTMLVHRFYEYGSGLLNYPANRD